MNLLWQVPAVMVTLVTWLTMPPPTLADIGRREALRRQLTSVSVKSVTNEDLPPVPVAALMADPPAQAGDPDAGGDDARAAASQVGGEAALTVGPGAVSVAVGAGEGQTQQAAVEPAQAVAGAGQAQPPAPAGQAQPPAAAPAPPRDEKVWRERVATAQATLERDQVLLAAMQSRINALSTDVVNRDDPAQQADLRAQLQRAVSERDRLQKQVEADTKAIEDIRTEARRLGIPPGWVR